MTLIDDCLFCKILRGEIPSLKVYEDDMTYSFMDIMPQSKGHHLVIPKFHTPDFFDLPVEYAHACIDTAQKLARAARKGLDPDGVMIMQLNGAAAGQTVWHYHVHIIPRWEGVDLKLHARQPVEPATLAPIADQIKGALG